MERSGPSRDYPMSTHGTEGVFTADDGTPEITKLDVAIDEREIARFDVVSHVPAASGASAVVALNTETLGTLFHATDTGKVLHVLVSPVRLSYDFDLTGFATAADVFTGCMLRNAPSFPQRTWWTGNVPEEHRQAQIDGRG